VQSHSLDIQRVAKRPDYSELPVHQNYGVVEVLVVVLVVVPVEVVAGAPVVVVVVVDVAVASGVDVVVPVVVVVVSEEPPHAANEATSAKLAAARAMVWNFEVIKSDRLLLCLMRLFVA
jgi:hypothetical protein